MMPKINNINFFYCDHCGKFVNRKDVYVFKHSANRMDRAKHNMCADCYVNLFQYIEDFTSSGVSIAKNKLNAIIKASQEDHQ